jgi:hypothetical protein
MTNATRPSEAVRHAQPDRRREPAAWRGDGKGSPTVERRRATAPVAVPQSAEDMVEEHERWDGMA